ncbi:MAG: tetratricopeptide repeat protein [Treponemataceae bacterium]|nr:tetratricopeptide repeat protein [Treponemataceae bacterium]HOJ99718.1 tetratricopeptide repeat protein [Termitinemataceae bacterium]
MDNEHLQKYIAQIHRIKGKVQDKKEDFETVARELGITSQDLQEIYQYAASCHIRAQELLRSGFYREALACAQEAHDIVPWDAEICALLGTIYKTQGERSFFPFPSYRKALFWYQRATELQPSYSTVYEQMRYIQRRIRQGIQVGIFLGVMIALLAITFIVLRNTQSVPSSSSALPAPTEGPGSTNRGTPPIVQPNPEQTIPLRVLFSENQGLSFHLQSSTLYRYGSTEPAFSLNIKGTLQAHQKEIYEITLTQSWYDTKGNLLFKGSKKVLSPPNAPLEPGDVLPINLLVYEKQSPPPIAQVTLELEKIDGSPRSQASVGTAVPIRWIASPPEGTALEISLRSQQIHSFKDTHYVKSTITITNRGEKRIRFLRISPIYGKGASELRGKEIIVLSRDNAYLSPGDRYPFFIINMYKGLEDPAPARFEPLTIEIREIE